MSWEGKTMRSKTSFFNRTIFIKTMARFWPLWAAYFAVWFLCLPLPIGVGLSYSSVEQYMREARALVFNLAALGGVAGGFITAALSAMAVWSFMYNARSMSGMASLPVRREGVFFSVTLAGIAPVLAVNVLIVLCTLVVELTCGQTDAAALFQWLAVVSLIYVFFYGFAVFCAQLTGNVLILPAVYAVLNFTVYVVWEMVNALCNIFLYGMDGNIRLGNPAKVLSPPVKLWLTGTSDAIEPIQAWNAEAGMMRTVSYELHGWGMYAAYAAAGLIFAALALWLYKRRRMETAGDTVAVEVLKPVFKYCMGIGGALVLALLVYSIIGGIAGVRMKGAVITLLLMFLGAFVGWTAAKMLIHKSFRVWKRDWLGLGICCAAAAVFMLGMECDLVGYEKHVPDAAEVNSVYVSCQGDGMTINDPANIEAVTALHRSIVEHKDRYETMQEELRSGVWMEDYNSVYVFITYALSGDSYVSRRYHLGYFAEQAETLDDVLALQTLANTDEAVKSRKTPSIPVNAETAYYGYVESTVFRGEAPFTADYEEKDWDEEATNWRKTWDFTPTELTELYETCVVPDIEDGILGRVWYITDEEYENTVYNARIYIELRQPITDRIGHSGTGPEYAVGEYSYATFYTTPTVDSWRTNAWLEKHGVVLHTIAEVSELAQQYDEEYYGPAGAPFPTTASDLIIADGRVG